MEHVTENCTCEGKRCTKCKEVKCLEHFAKSKRHKNGIYPSCNLCNKAYYTANAEAINARHKAYYREHVEQKRAYAVEYYHSHAEQAKAYRKARADHRREYNRNYDVTHPEMRKSRSHAYRQRHPDREARRQKHWVQNNPAYFRAHIARRRTFRTQAGGSYTSQEWEALKAQYDYTCLRCGRRVPEIKLTADHIVPVSLLGSSDISNIQPLCKSCNSWKSDKFIDFRPEKLDRSNDVVI